MLPRVLLKKYQKNSTFQQLLKIISLQCLQCSEISSMVNCIPFRDQHVMRISCCGRHQLNSVSQLKLFFNIKCGLFICPSRLKAQRVEVFYFGLARVHLSLITKISPDIYHVHDVQLLYICKLQQTDLALQDELLFISKHKPLQRLIKDLMRLSFTINGCRVIRIKYEIL